MKSQLVHLEEVAEFINGRAFKPSDWSDSGLPIIRIQNLTGTNDAFNHFDGVIDERVRVRRGDILISWSASLGVYRWQGNDAVLNQHIFKARLSKGVEPDYFFYVATNAVQEMVSRVHGSTMQHITKDRFDSIQIRLPDLSEQQRIAGRLEQADRLCRTRRYALELTDTFLPAAFLEFFGDPVRNARGWPVCELEELATVERGKFTPRPRNDPSYYSGRFPFIQTGDISTSEGRLRSWTQTLNEKGVKVSRRFPPGTVVIAIVGATIGMTAILEVDVYCPDSVVGIQVNPKAATKEYIEFLLRFWRPVFLAQAPETARANINLDTLRPLRIPVPPLALQQKFAALVERVERLRAVHREALRQAEHLFASLLDRAFSG